MSRLPPVESLDLSSKRSIDLESLDSDRAVVRYFYHAGEYWLAEIPLHGIDSIVGQAFNFSKVKKRKTRDGEEEVLRNELGTPRTRFGFINHCQSRFRMKPSAVVRLFGSDDVERKNVRHEISDFVYSIEAVGEAGAAFDFRNGILGTLVCAHRFLSTEEMVFERVVIQNYYVRESPPIPLTDSQKREILTRSLKRADEAGLLEPYYLFRFCGTNNCTSTPFQVIDACVDYTWKQWIGSFLYRLPLNPRFYLRVRGLDSDPRRFHLVRWEFPEFIEAASTRERKRKVVRAEIKKRRAAKGRRQ